MDTVTLRRFRKGDEFAVSDVICTTLAIATERIIHPSLSRKISKAIFRKGLLQELGKYRGKLSYFNLCFAGLSKKDSNADMNGTMNIDFGENGMIRNGTE